MVISKINPLLATDCYKMGHMTMYAPGTNKVYSYLTSRSDKNYTDHVFYGLQYYIKEYLSIPLTPEMGEEFIKNYKLILGSEDEDTFHKIRNLCNLGYFPIEIKAVKEGTVLSKMNVMMTVTNTHPDFFWCVGFIESLILKVWYSTTVATCCFKYRQLVNQKFEESVDPEIFFLKDFMVHDFGYRGDGTEEGAAISGMGHLLSFKGSDTIPALKFSEVYYGADTENNKEAIMMSVPASEHSVMCSYGKDDELSAFKNILERYPTGIVSIVSDTYDVYKVLTEFSEVLKPLILARDGRCVYRPDSGQPQLIICGIGIKSFQTWEDYNQNPVLDKPFKIEADNKYYKIINEVPQVYSPTNEEKGAIILLDEMFGHTINSKGYKMLHPKVGLIYGDGMYYERYEATLNQLMDMGYSVANLVIGVGGILRNHSRDTLGFALKATYVEVDGVPREIMKEPVTDSKKKSHKGLLSLSRVEDGSYVTKDCCTPEEEANSLLEVVYRDGKLLREQTIYDIRREVESHF